MFQVLKTLINRFVDGACIDFVMPWAAGFGAMPV